MEAQKEIYKSLLHSHKVLIRRELIDEVDWNHRLIAVKGFRGVGKTTFLLDYLKENFPNSDEVLYINLNNLYFTERRIFTFASDFYAHGGKLLVLDQIHKYPDWSSDLKYIYDKLPGLKVVFSTSSVMRINEGLDDLEGRCQVYHLEGLSFREYINYRTGKSLKHYTLDEILSNHEQIAREITSELKPLAYLKEYMESGIYPYFLSRKAFYTDDLLKHVNFALEIDVTYLNQIEIKYLPKLRKLLYLVASQAPFTPNVSRLSAEIETSRATVMNYLRYLRHARLIQMLYPEGDTDEVKKPSKIYVQNTNLAQVIVPENNVNNSMRRTFFLNQVGYRHGLNASRDIDFIIDNNHRVKVGGKYTDTDGADFAVCDRIQIGVGNRIPLWLFGFLY